MAAEVTVVFRDDEWHEENEDYELWLKSRLEEPVGITVMSIDIEEV